jgi:hypothetical protein
MSVRNCKAAIVVVVTRTTAMGCLLATDLSQCEILARITKVDASQP